MPNPYPLCTTVQKSTLKKKKTKKGIDLDDVPFVEATMAKEVKASRFVDRV